MINHTHDERAPEAGCGQRADPPRGVVVAAGRPTGLGIIALLLAVIATATVLRWDEAALRRFLQKEPSP